jgi:hypothetical protein
MLPQNFLVAAWPLRDLWDLLCQISDHRRKQGPAQKDAKITKIQIGRRLAEVLALPPWAEYL